MMYSNKLAERANSLMKLAIGVACIAVACVGCGKPSHQQEIATATGKVTLDGQPLASGYVVFVAANGRQSTGAIQPDGTFVMATYEEGDGARVGTHPVIVRPVPADEHKYGGPKPIPVPERYMNANTSGFTAEVKPGEDNYIELNLTTKDQK
jgi:hypothetical protein